jgi:chorismate dehydratase
MKACRLACVRYLNTVPLIEGLEKLGAVRLIPTVPARIADLVRTGEADVGLCSLVDLMRGDLAALSVGMIGCDGPTLTVRLFSSVPLDRIGQIHADTDSHTSVVLCRVLLRMLHGIEPEVVDFDARERIAVGPNAAAPCAGPLDEAWPATVLLIGDKVVVDAPPADRYPHQLDLGQAWKGLTGLPFVYALWACRADRVEDPLVLSAAALLDHQRRHNRTRLDRIATKHAPEHRWPVDLARRYLGSHLRFEVGPREREAVDRFAVEASRWLGKGRVQWARAEPVPV